jgi:hypothetical protein
VRPNYAAASPRPTTASSIGRCIAPIRAVCDGEFPLKNLLLLCFSMAKPTPRFNQK